MNTFHSISSLLKRSLGARRDPLRDWLTLLACAAIVLIGIVAWNVWAFDTVVQGGVIGSSGANPPQAVSGSALDNARTIIANRAAEEAKYRTGIYRYADPSQ
jgi:hypothetical protein